MGHLAAVDNIDQDQTQRITVPLSVIGKEDEVAGLQIEVGRLRALCDQMRTVIRLEREEICRLKGSNRGMEKKCSIYEAMIADFMMQLEGARIGKETQC